MSKRGVTCGGHFAASCKDCTKGNGPTWCNGDCKWNSLTKKCQKKGKTCDLEVIREKTGFSFLFFKPPLQQRPLQQQPQLQQRPKLKPQLKPPLKPQLWQQLLPEQSLKVPAIKCNKN